MNRFKLCDQAFSVQILVFFFSKAKLKKIYRQIQFGIFRPCDEQNFALKEDETRTYYSKDIRELLVGQIKSSFV